MTLFSRLSRKKESFLLTQKKRYRTKTYYYDTDRIDYRFRRAERRHPNIFAILAAAGAAAAAAALRFFACLTCLNDRLLIYKNNNNNATHSRLPYTHIYSGLSQQTEILCRLKIRDSIKGEKKN
uniref:Uncharacterized protein n=1 Tax=Glossina brevipalpis TaxID=37001 RepID=A0A1A9W1U2_9MUSC